MRKRSDFGMIVIIRHALLAVSTFGVIFCAGVQLLSVRYIIQNGLSSQFIENAGYLPKKPEVVFMGCILCLLVLDIVMMFRRASYIQNTSTNMTGAGIEIAAALIISILLNFSYPAIFLMVFCDCIFHFRRSIRGKWIIFVVAALYFFASYQLVSIIFPLMNPEKFFTVFPEDQSALLLLTKGIVEAVIIILSVSFIGIFLAWQIAENDDISQELHMVSQVNQELRNYAAITEKIGEDKERKRLAREIHDTLGHALTGIAAGIDACTAIIDKNPTAAKKQLQLVSGVVRQGISDVRSSLKKLRPGALEEQGLKGALQKMIDDFSQVSNLKIRFLFEADQADFDVAKEDVLFRLIQESLTNSTRHGRATEVSIHMYIEDNTLITRISDNGCGCEKIVLGYGLLQMQERIQTVHGRIAFDGSRGFTIQAALPLQKGETSL